MEKMERQLDYALSGYNVHDALKIVDRLIAERDGKAADKEYAAPESLKVFSPEEYEELQRAIDRDTAKQLKIKEFETLRRVDILSTWDLDEEEEKKAKVDEKDVEEDDGKEEKKDDGEEKGAKKELEEDAAVGKKD